VSEKVRVNPRKGTRYGFTETGLRVSPRARDAVLPRARLELVAHNVKLEKRGRYGLKYETLLIQRRRLVYSYIVI